jgi:hypothetical protein
MRLATQQEEMADRADRKGHASVAFQSVPPIVKLYAGNQGLKKPTTILMGPPQAEKLIPGNRRSS